MTFRSCSICSKVVEYAFGSSVQYFCEIRGKSTYYIPTERLRHLEKRSDSSYRYISILQHTCGLRRIFWINYDGPQQSLSPSVFLATHLGAHIRVGSLNIARARIKEYGAQKADLLDSIHLIVHLHAVADIVRVLDKEEDD